MCEHKVYFSICRAGACSRRRPIRTVGDACPYSEKTSVYVLSHPKSISGATRQVIAHTKKRCERDAASLLTNFKALWARRGEASHISKERCGVRDTAASVPATFLLLFSSPEKRRYFTQPRTKVPTTIRRLTPPPLLEGEALNVRRERAPALRYLVIIIT